MQWVATHPLTMTNREVITKYVVSQHDLRESETFL